MYRSFLLRIWRQHGGRVRASVQDVDTGEVDTFDRLDELCEWLEGRVDDGAERSAPDRPGVTSNRGRAGRRGEHGCSAGA